MIGAIGLLGSMACLLVLLSFVSPSTSPVEYASFRGAMGSIATWIFYPSLGLTLVSGLMAIAVNRAYHNAGWVWAKALSGILLFESGFVGVIGPMQLEATRSYAVLAGKADPEILSTSLAAERNTLWILLGLAIFNVAFGIWRPRLTRLPE